ncbi:type IV secretory system conjugative DNA transfer family protein [Helicobacter trogontum]|uniref:Type IV secretory system conjugative DNA transfer family protein n=1 Tax=Helicobacter trogontum TaxID=50960 RepID=A0A099VD70_9HELI|nr:type IV secretory system conjugative DNA transfer family protein [Helicobacter trogontum]TLD84676.1 type IV secretory system conjugative DNA transfer family protein [Helicobacter trogontum]
MQENKSITQTFLRGLTIILVSILMSIVIYYIANAWIFDINILDYAQNYENFIITIQNIGNPYLKLKAYYPLAYSLTPFICCIVYWLISNETIKNSYGNARFAKEKDFKEMGFNLDSKGVQLACLVKGKKRIPISTQKPLAILIVAPAGTGKTASIALPNLFSLPNSCFVLDIKGELLQKSAGYRQKHFNNKILVFSPLSKDSNTMFFNPFDNKIIKDMDFVELMQLADQVAGTIFVGEKGKENDHWIVSAKTLFTFFALYNMQKFKHTTLGDLSQAPKKDYFDELEGQWRKQAVIEPNEEDDDESNPFGEEQKDPEADIFKLWLQQTAEDTSLDDIVRNQARAYSKYAENEFASIKSTYDTFMKVFANPRVAKATSTMSFDYEDLREQKITCYVVIQSEDMDILAPLVRILVESFFKKLMKNENSDPNKFIYFILDEFIRFGKMSYLLEAPALCRSYGLIPIYITQSYEQIKKYYGDDDLKILRANAAFQVVFRMNSFDDAKTLSDMVGDFTRKKLSISKDSMAVLKKNNSISEEGYKLITPQDILSSPEGQVYVLAGGYLNRPIKTQANLWFKNKELNGADKIPYDLENKHLQEHAQANAEKNQKDIKTENESTKTTQLEQQEMETNSNDINNNVEKQISNNMEYNPFKYKEY